MRPALKQPRPSRVRVSSLAAILLAALHAGLARADGDNSACHSGCHTDRTCDKDWRSPGSCPVCLCDNDKRPPCRAGEIMACKHLPKRRETCPAGREWRPDPTVPAFGACARCEAGRARQASSVGGCLPCAAGQFQPLAGEPFCKQCAAGRSGLELQALKSSAGVMYQGRTSCKPCASGFYAERTGNAECKECPAGRWGKVGGTSHQCAGLCIAGRYGEAAQYSPKCSGPCMAGRYGHVGASTRRCTGPCMVGRYGTPGMTTPLCKAHCAPGRFARVGQGGGECPACGPGQYQPVGEQGSCHMCTAGYFDPRRGKVAPLTSCSVCPNGKITTEEGMDFCTDADMESVRPSSQGCEPGRVKRLVGHVAGKPVLLCRKCAAGQHAVGGQLAECKDCAIGKYAELPGMAWCEACKAGRESERIAAVACSPCSVGKYRALHKMQGCGLCPAGKYADAAAAASCAACPMGKFQPNNVANDETMVSYGELVADHCTVCPAGKRSSPGAQACHTTAAPTPSPTPPTPSPTPSPTPKRTTLAPSAAPTAAPTAAPVPATPAPTPPCPKGQFLRDEYKIGNFEVRNMCTDCPPGRYASRMMAKCAECAPGHFAAQGGSGTAACDGPCPVGKHSEFPYAKCVDCAHGFFQNATGGATCTPCAAGHYAYDSHVACKPCPRGWVAPEAGAATCVPAAPTGAPTPRPSPARTSAPTLAPSPTPKPWTLGPTGVPTPAPTAMPTPAPPTPSPTPSTPLCATAKLEMTMAPPEYESKFLHGFRGCFGFYQLQAGILQGGKPLYQKLVPGEVPCGGSRQPNLYYHAMHKMWGLGALWPYPVGASSSPWAPSAVADWTLYDAGAGKYRSFGVRLRCAALPTPAPVVPTPLPAATRALTPAPTPPGKVEVLLKVVTDHPWTRTVAKFKASEGQLADSIAATVGIPSSSIMVERVVDTPGTLMANLAINVPAHFCSTASHHACTEWKRSRLTSTAYVAQVFDAREFVGFLADQLSENGLFVTSRGLHTTVVSFTPGALPAGVAGLPGLQGTTKAVDKAAAAAGGPAAATPRSEQVKQGAAMPGWVKPHHYWIVTILAMGLVMSASMRWVDNMEKRHMGGRGYEVLPAAGQFAFVDDESQRAEASGRQFTIDSGAV